MNKQIIITGCYGFIGSHFTRLCLQRGWKVLGIDKLTYASDSNYDIIFREFDDNPNFKFECKDINEIDRLPECDYIVNFAAESHVGNSINNSEKFIHSNIKGVHNLLELIRTQSPHKKPIFIQISTDEVYGDIVNGSHKETDNLKPSNPYASSKASADLMVQAYHRTYGIPYIITRATNNYGCYQYPEKLIPRTIKNLSLGKKIELHNDGKPIRTWLHAEDTSTAILTLIDNEVVNQVYNISGGFELTNIEVVRKILPIFTNLPFTYKEENNYIDYTYNRPGQDVRYSLDDSKLRSLGWKPQKDFDQELPKIVEFYTNNYIW